MKTTMADGAHDRLDAQIAEALFGQPGMSKMDVANRVRELRGDGPALLVPREAEQDERARFEAWAHGECLSLHRWPHSGEYSDDRSSSAWKAWQFMLSAHSQVVGNGQ